MPALCVHLHAYACRAALQTGVEDPFTKQRAEKRERVKKQEKQQLANLKVRWLAGVGCGNKQQANARHARSVLQLSMGGKVAAAAHVAVLFKPAGGGQGGRQRRTTTHAAAGGSAAGARQGAARKAQRAQTRGEGFLDGCSQCGRLTRLETASSLAPPAWQPHGQAACLRDTGAPAKAPATAS